MGKGGGGSSAPDPEKTAAAQAYWNTYDTYGPDGSGVRHGYTDSSGNFVLPGQQAGNGGQQTAPQQAIPNQTSEPYPGFYQEFLGPQYDRPPAGPGGGYPGGAFRQEPAGNDRLRQAKKYVESPTEQAIRELLNPASVNFTGQMIEDNVNNMPAPGRVPDRGRVASDIFNRNFSMMAPAIEQGNDRLITNLQGRGLPVGSEAFNEAYGAQQRETQDTISRLAQDANVAAGQEQTRQLSMDQSVRQNAMSEIAALMGGGYQPPPKVPSAGGPNIDYASMAANQAQAQQAADARKAQSRNSTLSTIGTLGAALIKSAGHAKHMTGQIDTEWARDVVQSLPVYEWQYRSGEGPDGDTATHIGPLAEHFHGLTGLSSPEAINVIDYLGLLLAALQDMVNRVEVLENAMGNERIH